MRTKGFLTKQQNRNRCRRILFILRLMPIYGFVSETPKQYAKKSDFFGESSENIS